MTAMRFAPLPQTAAWRHVDAQDGFESVFLRDVASGHVIDGHTTAIEDGEVWAVHYTVEVDERWRTQHCRVWSWSAMLFTFPIPTFTEIALLLPFCGVLPVGFLLVASP